MDKQNEKDNTLEFISMYRNLECLWRVQCKDYSNKNKRNSALDALLDIYRKVVPGAKKADVLRKINTLRSSFRRELKKINESKKSGSGTDELYTSSLYYFDELRFVADQDVPRQSTSTLEEYGNTRVSTSLAYMFTVHSLEMQ